MCTFQGDPFSNAKRQTINDKAKKWNLKSCIQIQSTLQVASCGCKL